MDKGIQSINRILYPFAKAVNVRRGSNEAMGPAGPWRHATSHLAFRASYLASVRPSVRIPRGHSKQMQVYAGNARQEKVDEEEASSGNIQRVRMICPIQFPMTSTPLPLLPSLRTRRANLPCKLRRTRQRGPAGQGVRPKEARFSFQRPKIPSIINSAEGTMRTQSFPPHNNGDHTKFVDVYVPSVQQHIGRRMSSTIGTLDPASR